MGAVKKPLIKTMKRKITLDDIANICRIILAVVFIFSGFMKTIDPWGTAVKIREYLDFFHMGWLSGWSIGIGIWLCAAELMMGCMLLFKVRLRLISIFALLTMTFFTILTLIIAVWNPLDDCGCFGDAIKIENWHSFFKNLILWPMSIVVWYSCRGRKILNFSRKEIILTLLFATLAGSLGAYSWRHLPLVDLYPYKVGTDLRTDVLCTRCADRNLKLIYADRQSGELREFELSDTTWYDDSRWEYVRTTDPYELNPPRILDYDFAMWREDLNHADDVIYREGETVMVVVRNFGAKKPAGCEKRLLPYLDRLYGEGVNVIVAAGILEGESAPSEVEMGGRTYPCYGMERELLQLLLRADVGAVTIRDGVITDKKSCWDLR